MNAKDCANTLKQEISKVFIGKEDKIELIICSIFAGGHVLLDDLPGSGKTTLVKTLTAALGCEYSRIQFTPDLLPSDIIGMSVFDRASGSLRCVKGPVFTNMLLADEINRAIPRTQAALLEAMEEHQVTIDGESFELPDPFFVMATQNPVERESTFKLPAAQMDRFFMRLSLGFPSADEEVLMLSKHGNATDYSVVSEITNPAELMEIRGEIRNVSVSDDVKSYIVELVRATRQCPDLKMGGSPRASRSLYAGAQSLAAISGRDYATPDDVAKIFIPVLSHRVVLSSEAMYSAKKPEDILREVFEKTEVPPYHGRKFYE